MNRVAIVGAADTAIGWPGKIDRARIGCQTHAHLSLDRDRTWSVCDTKLAEQSQVHMTDKAVLPPIKQVLAVRLDALQHDTVDERSLGSETTLRR